MEPGRALDERNFGTRKGAGWAPLWHPEGRHFGTRWGAIVEPGRALERRHFAILAPEGALKRCYFEAQRGAIVGRQLESGGVLEGRQLEPRGALEGRQLETGRALEGHH